MILRITRDCIITLCDNDSGEMFEKWYSKDDEIYWCYFKTARLGAPPDIVFYGEFFSNCSAINVSEDLYEIIGEKMEIRFLQPLEINDGEEEGPDITPSDGAYKCRYNTGEIVECIIYKYAEYVDVDIEMGDGVTFKDINAEIFKLIRRL
jgi:hypothetical protein